MIETGGRTDVIAQWFSDGFMKDKDNSKLFKKVLIGPGEALVVLKDGKVKDVYTESKVKVSGGFWSNLFGTDTQAIMVDLKAFAVNIPFSGYTKDRTSVSGTVGISARISKDNIMRLLGLFRRNLVLDDKWGSLRGSVKEVTQEDIVNIVSYDTKLAIDCNVLSKTLSSEIRDDMDGFNARIRNAIDSMSNIWVESGLAVDVAKANVDTNAYEDAMRYADELSKIQLNKDAEFLAKSKDIESVANINILMVKKKSELELADLTRKYDNIDYSMGREMQEEMNRLDQDLEINRKKLNAELENAKTQAEIDKINGISANDRKRDEIELNNYAAKLEYALKQEAENNRVKNEIELIKANQKVEIDKAFQDGVDNGRKMAADDAYDKGYANGLRDANADGKKDFIEIIRATQQPAQYYPPQGYYQPNPQPPQGYYQPNPQPPQGYYQPQPPPMQYAQPVNSQPPQQQTTACPSCGAANSPGSRFCFSCRKPLTGENNGV